jgi:hypothetical protein
LCLTCFLELWHCGACYNLCVTVARTGSDDRRARSCVNASILHITRSGRPIVLSLVWPLKMWFSPQETSNWIHNASSTTFPVALLGTKNHHKGCFELRVWFTKVCSPSSQESACTISSGWCGKHGAPQDLKPLRRGLTPTRRDGAGRLLWWRAADFSEPNSELKTALMMVLGP